MVGMAELGGRAACSRKQPVVEVKPHADTVIEHDHGKCPAVLVRVRPVQRLGDHVGVVGNVAIRPEGFVQWTDDRDLAPGKGGAPGNDAGFRFDDTLCGNADFPNP